MSTITKWVIAIAVIVGAAWFLWWSGWLGTPAQAPTISPDTAATPASTDGMSSPSDTSDAALLQDATAIDTQLNALSDDSTNLDASLADQPIPQAY